MRQPNVALVAPPEDDASGPGGGGAAGAAGGTSKQARVQALMGDTSLSAKERQARIQAVMREAASPAGTGSPGGGEDRLREQQVRVAKLIAVGKAQLGELGEKPGAAEGAAEASAERAGDRGVEVRVVLSTSEGQVATATAPDLPPLGVPAGCARCAWQVQCACRPCAHLRWCLA